MELKNGNKSSVGLNNFNLVERRGCEISSSDVTEEVLNRLIHFCIIQRNLGSFQMSIANGFAALTIKCMFVHRATEFQGKI